MFLPVLLLFTHPIDLAPTQGVIDWGCETHLLTMPTATGIPPSRQAVVTVHYKDAPDFRRVIWQVPEPPGTPVKQQKRNLLEGNRNCGIWTADFLERQAKGQK
jgi:hypothetical protein